jgi:hypothetical protein
MRFEFLTVVKMSSDGGSMFLQNLGIYLQLHTALQPRRPTLIGEEHFISVKKGIKD